jgi:hypothetical protein
MPVILAIQEAEIRKAEIGDQPVHKVQRPPPPSQPIKNLSMVACIY